MPDYQAMYYKLFNAVTDAIDTLQRAQISGEDAYITSKDEPILFPLPEGGIEAKGPKLEDDE